MSEIKVKDLSFFIESCPSFAELGVALDSLVSGEREGESLSLTPQFQFMLSWCWVNLKVREEKRRGVMWVGEL